MKKELTRNTKETQITLALEYPGEERRLDTNCGFLNHMLDLLCHRAGLVGHPVVVVDLVPGVAAALGILPAVQLADDPEAVGDGLVGILPLKLVVAGQAGVSVADGLEDFSAALCAKNIVHVRFSFLRCSRTTCFRSRTTRSPRNSH